MGRLLPDVCARLAAADIWLADRVVARMPEMTMKARAPGPAALCSALLIALGIPFAQAQEGYDPSMDALMWESVRGCTKIEEVKIYLDLFPEGIGKHAAEAKECIAWDGIQECGDIGDVEQFLRTFPAGPHAREAQACLARLEAEERQQALVEDLMRECLAHHEANRLTTGSGGNALECYRRVLDEDPGNARALEGISSIEEHYVERAVAALEREQAAAASRSVDRLEAINPEHRQVDELRERIAGLQRSIAERERQAAELEELRRTVARLINEGRFEEARAQLASGEKRGLPGKELQALAQQIEEASQQAEVERQLRETEAAVRALIEQGELAEAQAVLAEARRLGLDAATDERLTTAVRNAMEEARQAADREAMLTQSDALLEREEYAAARAALDRASDLGLPDPDYRERMDRIDRQEAAAEAEAIESLLSTCARHHPASQLAEALTCYREVLTRDPGHDVAAAEVRRLEPLVAWSEAAAANTVDAYFEFESVHADSPFAKLARHRLTDLEAAYWQQVQGAGTRDAYARYLEIYPEGGFAALAARRIAPED